MRRSGLANLFVGFGDTPDERGPLLVITTTFKRVRDLSKPLVHCYPWNDAAHHLMKSELLNLIKAFSNATCM
jgi:hypothetical protein